MIDELIADLKREEGWKSHVYKDHLGYDTIGYGFLVDAKKDGGLPLSIGEMWLRQIVDQILAELPQRWAAFDVQEPDVQRALVQMAYQMGVSGVLEFKLMLAALERGDRETAAVNALESRWARQTPGRAERVATLIRGFEGDE